jgi:hypothetical protein
MPMNAIDLVSVVPLVMLLAAAAANGRGVPTGTWGGDHVVAEVSDKGAEIEFDCANGRIEEAIQTDSDGKFDVKGTYKAEHGGPVRDDEPGPAPVRYRGTVKGDTMTLGIVRTDDTVGPFTLTHGREVNLTKCR